MMFAQMKEHVETQYGVRSLGTEFRVRRSTTVGGAGRGAGRSIVSVGGAGRAGSEDGEETLQRQQQTVAAPATTPGPVSRSRTNLMAKLGGVNRKKSRASEERLVAGRSGGVNSRWADMSNLNMA